MGLSLGKIFFYFFPVGCGTLLKIKWNSLKIIFLLWLLLVLLLFFIIIIGERDENRVLIKTRAWSVSFYFPNNDSQTTASFSCSPWLSTVFPVSSLCAEQVSHCVRQIMSECNILLFELTRLWVTWLNWRGKQEGNVLLYSSWHEPSTHKTQCLPHSSRKRDFQVGRQSSLNRKCGDIRITIVIIIIYFITSRTMHYLRSAWMETSRGAKYPRNCSTTRMDVVTAKNNSRLFYYYISLSFPTTLKVHQSKGERRGEKTEKKNQSRK